MIETLATSGSNESLDECILPRRVRRREYFINPHRLGRDLQLVERMIAIVDQVSRRLVPRKGLAPLLRRPRRRRMSGDRLCFANIPTVYESPRIADQTHASRVAMTFAPIATSGGLTPSMVAVGSCEPVRIDFQHALRESAARIQASGGERPALRCMPLRSRT